VKTIKTFLLSGLITVLSLIMVGRVTAQTFTVLHQFAGSPADGANPHAGLNLSGNILYGTTQGGGELGNGTVFAVNADGAGFTNLHSFIGSPDGNSADAGVILLGNMLYGTTVYGGSYDNGTVFTLKTNGTGLTTLHSFSAYPGSAPYTNSDGVSPHGGLASSGNMLYGTAVYGGSFGNGTVFAVNTNGAGFTNLHSFTATSGSPATNSDGAQPYESLILSGSTLYGMTLAGGNSGNGAVFSINTDGSGFTNLHSFTATSGSTFRTNSDGAQPHGLILAGNTLYGTASGGGSSGQGTVFKVNTDGSGLANLHSFTALSGIVSGTNSDGAQPGRGLVLWGSTLYGTAFVGGNFQNGTVFAVNTNGTGFINLHSFAAGSGFPNPINSEGIRPLAGLILSGNTLYGTTSIGGTAGYGTVFSLSLPSPPQLAITRSGANVILSWPSNATGFVLQSATNLASPVIWTTIGGQNVVTNPVAGPQKFYRLIK
jgi:uncharacterized repeat protein (TIGR03803 family)